MNTITFQVPVNPILKNQAQEKAYAMGFSSLQEAVRLFLRQLADNSVRIQFSAQFPTKILTSKQEKHLSKTLAQSQDSIKKGKYKTVQNIDEMMDYLQS